MMKTKKKGELDIPAHIMDDLSSRFIINSEKRHHPVQVFDVMEQAHWHYSDFYCLQMKPPPPRCSHKVLSRHMLSYVRERNHFLGDFDHHYHKWQKTKRQAPCFGGILLTPNFTHVLMVQGFGNKTTWGFPKGKKETLEFGIDCAIREIEEETGLNVSDKIFEERGIVQWINGRFYKLYIIPDVPHDATIQAKLRREIKDHKWIPVDTLPMHCNDTAPQQADLKATSFFNVSQFVRPLRKWIEEQNQAGQQQQTMPAASQFTAKGRRRGKGKDVTTKRQGAPGPDGDAPSSSREGEGRGGRQVAKNLGEQFKDMAGNHDTTPEKLVREESGRRSTGHQQHEEDATANPGNTDAPKEIQAGRHVLRLDQFHSTAMRNFRCDMQPILDFFQWW